jgi:hypothetical protein
MFLLGSRISVRVAIVCVNARGNSYSTRKHCVLETAHRSHRQGLQRLRVREGHSVASERVRRAADGFEAI